MESEDADQELDAEGGLQGEVQNYLQGKPVPIGGGCSRHTVSDAQYNVWDTILYLLILILLYL